ncbi:glycoside hydrolase superfamily [Chytriomyces sp. MP71]|nr:glycoside hydrolase superfamily [Chytriomyces sp. MP71]
MLGLVAVSATSLALWAGVSHQAPSITPPIKHTISTRVEPCADARLAQTPLCNASLSTEERAAHFVALLSLTEKVGEMRQHTPGVSRLGLPPYVWQNEALHGIGFVNCVDDNGTKYCPCVFPAALGQAAAFNMDLVGRIAEAASNEARVLHRFNDGNTGLNFWAPHINIYRDPRWGRGQETPGEDPFLTSNYALHFITKFQESKQGRAKLMTSLKHFAVYNVETNRNGYNAVVSKVDLHQTFLPAFKTAIEDAKAAGVMCSYNAVNGVPACASTFLLQDILRGSWKFNGSVVSDCGAVGDIYHNHKFNKTIVEAAAQAVIAGTDLECGGGEYNRLPEAIEQGLLTEQHLDQAVTRLLINRLDVGLYDPFETQEFNQLPLNTLDSPNHRQLAREAARQAFVLLKNEGKRLPLQAGGWWGYVTSLAVIGPHSSTTRELMGNYIPYENGHADTITDGLRAAFTKAKVTSSQGVPIKENDDSKIDEAITLASTSEVVVLTLGIDLSIEDESRDRDHIDLPGRQLELLQRVTAASKNPVILVLIGGGSLDISWAKNNPRVGAILFGPYPGIETAAALADVLSGAYSPAGRLPITFYSGDYIRQVDLSRPDMREGPGRTYRFYTGTPLYPFGYGLSYTQFTYQATGSAAVHVASNERVVVSVVVKNVGWVASDLSVLAFVKADAVGCPLRQLFWFKRLNGVKSGATETVEVVFEPLEAFCVDTEGRRVAPPGNYTLEIGDGQVVKVVEVQ